MYFSLLNLLPPSGSKAGRFGIKILIIFEFYDLFIYFNIKLP